MRGASFFISAITVLAATAILQQLGVLAAPTDPSPPVTIMLNTTVSDPAELLMEARATSNIEFVGFHGTNGANANVYQAQARRTGGGIPVPPAFNGADAELGPGIYVTDDITVAQFFAQSSASANQNRGNTRDGANVPVICAVTANSQNNWRTGIRKVWIPVGDIAQSVNGKNDPTRLARQQARIQAVHGTTTNTVRFSVLNVHDPQNIGTGNQLVIPSGIQNQFSIRVCAPVSRSVSQLPAQLGHSAFPQFNYQRNKPLWHIA
ncbi:hypothetical protein QCA50_006700 [Cerrena zonata]|uniref:Uncharacterized protein n=1 Tax=Cerrena zonata TaxID=2478898 RepID=A0AAW0GLU6_9APHY